MPQHQPLTHALKAQIEKQKERRRRDRQRREDEYRRRVERLRRQIAEARRRRQQMLLLFLLAVLELQESILATFRRSYIHLPDPAPEPKDWAPDPANDFAPRPGDDYCDGYSRRQWDRMAEERGIKPSRKAEIKAAWEADPDRERFPTRYQEWGYKPHLGQIMYDLTAPYWQQDALSALKLLSPPETHKYLAEACLTDLRDLLMCRAESSDEIVRNFRVAAHDWDIRKDKEAEEARKEKELSRKNDDKGIPEPN